MWFLKQNLYPFLCFCCGFLICMFVYPNREVYLLPRIHKPDRIIYDTIYIHDTIYLKKVNASYYNPTKGQCDSSPFHTADGTFLSKKTKNTVSLSRDLLRKYPFGSKIEVVHPKKLKGIYTVHDCMHKRFRNKIDFFTFGTINIRNVFIKYN
jgi:3D (Asp-Asp-Asp) domain-containing protein